MICFFFFVFVYQSQDQILGKDSHINASVPSDASVDESASIDAVLINTHQVSLSFFSILIFIWKV